MLLQPIADQLQVTNGIPLLFDLDTAVGQQLDYVGQWIGKTRNIEESLTGVFFSFDTAGLGFDEGTWADTASTTVLTALPDAQYRLLLYATVAENHWDGTVPNAEKYLNAFWNQFGYYEYIIDNQDMTVTFLLVGPPLNALTAALYYGGYLDIVAAGVGVANHLWVEGSGGIPFAPIFGFDEENFFIAGFDHGIWDGAGGNIILTGDLDAGGLVESLFNSTPPTTLMLMHFDGLNGSQTFVDQYAGVYGYGPWTASGTTVQPALSTVSHAPLTGNTASLLFSTGNGRLDNLSPIQHAMGFGSADFTVEFWINTTSNNFFVIWEPGSQNFGIGINSSGVLNVGEDTTFSGSILGVTAVNDGTWHACAYCRKGTTGYFFVDGHLDATVTDSSVYSPVWTNIYIGPSGGGIAGTYLDELRVSLGARYTATYPVATSEFLS
jgi:Protein of unknown function (DUF2612)/Concanavalin A-like lectin/glucanases superfamily